MGRDRSSETREEMMERQREYQAVQAERKSWMQEQAEEFPGADYVHGVSPVLAALRAGRRTPHRLFMQAQTLKSTLDSDFTRTLQIITFLYIHQSYGADF